MNSVSLFGYVCFFFSDTIFMLNSNFNWPLYRDTSYNWLITKTKCSLGGRTMPSWFCCLLVTTTTTINWQSLCVWIPTFPSAFSPQFRCSRERPLMLPGFDICRCS